MKRIYFASLLLIFNLSCNQDDDISTAFDVNFRVNHYQNTGFGESKTLVLMVQKNDEVFTGSWYKFYDQIEGFTYEPGYMYNLSVKVSEVENPSNDGSSLRYVLNEIVSKHDIDYETIFEVDLKINGQTFINTSNNGLSYQILNQINLNCSNLCNELNEYLNEQDFVKGVFKRLSPDEIELVGIF